jgi:hypothetical protein
MGSAGFEGSELLPLTLDESVMNRIMNAKSATERNLIGRMGERTR